MPGQQMDPDEWDTFWRSRFDTLGAADRWRRAHGISITGWGPPADNTEGLSAVDDESENDEPKGGLTMAGGAPAVGDVMGMIKGQSQEEAAWRQQDAAERRAQYEAALRALQQQQFGPSRTAQLFRLAAAIGTPMLRPSFGGVMANVAPVLADAADARQKAQQDRAAALQALQQSYFSGNSAARAAEFQAKRAAWAPLARLAATYAKPPQPYSYQLDPNGKVREVPKTVHRPMTPAEYDAIPVGEYFVVPDGPEAGTVVRKLPPKG